ncbi:hypothetical protein N7474_001726 [Penicillium riverlandense]|uniref:uncharacterized protein n=1 Tax=Penicillium riverlandense TaxID=1903569 RepID=UPI002546EEEC|nr:uncharacterized protein N7474_001726 [Penicillium riverlandense]KAJ5833415.1 hypothetical protein N7474_001726 [Penicillium riverlandense]
MNASDNPTDPKDQKSFEMSALATDDAGTQRLGLTDTKNTPEAQEDTGLADLDGIKRNWTLRGLIIIWVSAALMSFVTNLNNTSSSTFAPYAASSFSLAPLVGTIAVVQAVIASVSLQPLARFADVYGRPEMFSFCILMATLGVIMLSSSATLGVYAGAQVFWVIGLQGISLMLQILAGDSSDLYNRALMNAIPYAPSIITTWITGPFASSVLKISWRWGFGIFAILIPIVGSPLLASLYYNKRKATKQRKAEGTYKRSNHLRNIVRLDPVGLILFAAGLSLILVPITLAASSSSTWKTTHIIVMLVIGAVSLVAFVVWEIMWAPWPILSMRLFKSRTVIFGLAASLIDYTALYLLQDYLTIYELVAAGLSVKAATNVAVLVPFAGVPGQFAAAFLVKYTKRYKWITVSGYALNLLGLGLAYKYINGHYHMGALVVAQLILGFGQGVINTMQLGMQASVGQKGKIPVPRIELTGQVLILADMAAVTALYTAALGVGSAIGGAVSGGVWTAVLPRRLGEYLPKDALSKLPEIEGDINLDMEYPWGSPIRDAIGKSYTSTFRLMLLIALILEAFAIAFAVFIEDLSIKEVDDAREYKGIVIGKAGAVDALKGKVHAGEDGDHRASVAPMKETTEV